MPPSLSMASSPSTSPIGDSQRQHYLGCAVVGISGCGRPIRRLSVVIEVAEATEYPGTNLALLAQVGEQGRPRLPSYARVAWWDLGGSSALRTHVAVPSSSRGGGESAHLGHSGPPTSPPPPSVALSIDATGGLHIPRRSCARMCSSSTPARTRCTTFPCSTVSGTSPCPLRSRAGCRASSVATLW